jgi:TRAP-type transport system periplasmic protein
MKAYIVKPVVFFLVGMMLIITFLAACSAPAATTATQQKSNSAAISTGPVKMRMATALPATNPIELVNQKWIAKIESETKGRVQISYYPGSTLVDQFGAYDELLAGVADITQCSGAMPGAPFPLSAAIPTFFYGTDLSTARSIWNELWKQFPELRNEYTGAHMLYIFGGTPQYIHSKKPIRTLEGFKGLQLMPSPSYPALLVKLGATGSMVPVTELYPALEKGIIDGTIMPADALKGSNIADLTQYSTNLNLPVPPSIFYPVNLSTWNKLPPDIQKIFDDSVPWINAEMDKVLLETEKEAIDYSKAKGHEFFELSPADLNKFYGVMEEISQEKADELDAKGLPGTKIFQETRRLIEEYNNSK